MRHLHLTVLILGVASACFGQSGRTYSSVGGFGNVLYPGTGHAPNAVPGPPPSFAQRLGNNIAGYPGYPGYAPQVNHPGHGRLGVVPYPVFFGGYGGYGYGGYDAPPQQYQQAPPPIVNTNTAPSVVINQTFIPERSLNAAPQESTEQAQGMRMYEGLRTTPQEPQRTSRQGNDQPTLYLIAFKDHTIVPALGYWIESGDLRYVSAEHSVNQVSLDLIDRELSQQLNGERGVEFKLPKAQ